MVMVVVAAAAIVVGVPRQVSATSQLLLFHPTIRVFGTLVGRSLGPMGVEAIALSPSR